MSEPIPSIPPTSEPPIAKTIRAAHGTIITGLAIVGVVVLCALGRIEGELAVMCVAGLAGIHGIGQRLSK